MRLDDSSWRHCVSGRRKIEWMSAWEKEREAKNGAERRAFIKRKRTNAAIKTKPTAFVRRPGACFPTATESHGVGKTTHAAAPPEVTEGGFVTHKKKRERERGNFFGGNDDYSRPAENNRLACDRGGWRIHQSANDHFNVHCLRDGVIK